MSEGGGVRSVLEPGAEGGTIECETVLGAMVAAVLQAGGTDADAISAARNDVLTEMGEAALVDVCAVIGMFDGINKLADMKANSAVSHLVGHCPHCRAKARHYIMTKHQDYCKKRDLDDDTDAKKI